MPFFSSDQIPLIALFATGDICTEFMDSGDGKLAIVFNQGKPGEPGRIASEEEIAEMKAVYAMVFPDRVSLESIISRFQKGLDCFPIPSREPQLNDIAGASALDAVLGEESP